MKSSTDLKVYVEVDTKEKYSYRVMCYANGKIPNTQIKGHK
ncbi:hypothetical protein [Helicobacter apodemus]|nr:hypothetical protein [Helicobacter apodemus]